ncbi:MAG: dTMP kinase [Acidobacteria bacterium]|nr:dTMP kinase [Acidobacteriota bacterium]
MKPIVADTGLFITLEGGEGSGKSTQGEMLTRHLQEKGYRVVWTKEPGGTDIGQALRKVVMSNRHGDMVPETELLIYLADRTQHVKSKILPAIREGNIVISDRYHDSSVAYQHFARGVPMATLDFLFQNLAGGLVPDITFILDISPDTAMKRIEKRTVSDPGSMSKFEEETLSFHKKVRQGFLEIAAKEPNRVKVIPADQPRNEIFNRILSFLNPVLPAIPDGEKSS